MPEEEAEESEYRIIFKSGAAITLRAVNVQFDGQELAVFMSGGRRNSDIFIQGSEVAAVVPVEFLSEEK